MKKYLLLFLLFIGFTLQSEACIEPHPDSLIINFNIDTVNCDLIVEISNIQIMGGESNQFCSCGVNDAIAGMGDIIYLVFVDSVTNEPVLGFDQFALNEFAGDAWDLASSSFDWNGFVSDINSSGLIQDQAVTLWIRIDLFDVVTIGEWQFNPCEDLGSVWEIASSGGLGTDEWDDANNVLADHHQSISYFYANDNQFSVNVVPDGYCDYFDDIVETYYSTLSIESQEKGGFSFYPNPTNDLIYLKNTSEINEIIIYNTVGEIVLRSNVGENEILVNHLPIGLYHLRAIGLDNDFVRTFIKQ